MAIQRITSQMIGTDVIVAEDLAANSVTVSEIADGAVTTAKILDSNITTAKIANSAITNDKIAAFTIGSQKLEFRDYFRFRINSAVANLSDNTEYVVPFNTNGVVDYDSNSGFSGDANNTWTPPLSTHGETQFWIFGISAGIDGDGTGTLRDASVGIQQSTSAGAGWTDLFVNTQRFYDGSQDQEGSTLSSTYMHAIVPTADYRYRMMVHANTDATTWDLEAGGSQIQGGSASFDDNSLSWWWGIRVY